MPSFVGGSPTLASVPEGSRFGSLGALIGVGRAEPGSVSVAASGAGSIHCLEPLAREDGSGAGFRSAPRAGSGPSPKAAPPGGVEAAMSSPAERAAPIEGGEPQGQRMRVFIGGPEP